jgi:[ribosomal protein S18]-alanine N-acetyltransferase
VAKPFILRAMAPDDIDEVIAVAAVLPGAPHWPRSSYEAIFASAASLQRIAIVSRAPGHSLAGFVIAAVLPPQAELESIAVAAQFQRQGVATGLFASLQVSLRARACSEILLEVRQSNHAAQALYRAIGFAQAARRPAYYSHPVEDAILMSRSL